MNCPSIAILAVLFALIGLSAWRLWKKGAPCSCGCEACGKCKCNCKN